MSFTTDMTTDIGLVRVKISDTNSAKPIFLDDVIDAFLSFEGDVLRASAGLLEAIAASQALKLKVIQVLTLRTDGAKLADSLLKLASAYREQADFRDAASGGNFDWAEFVDDQFSARERLMKELLRENA